MKRAGFCRPVLFGRCSRLALKTHGTLTGATPPFGKGGSHSLTRFHITQRLKRTAPIKPLRHPMPISIYRVENIPEFRAKFLRTRLNATTCSLPGLREPHSSAGIQPTVSNPQAPKLRHRHEARLHHTSIVRTQRSGIRDTPLPIQRTHHPAPALVQYMGVNHRRRHIRMP